MLLNETLLCHQELTIATLSLPEATALGAAAPGEATAKSLDPADHIVAQVGTIEVFYRSNLACEASDH